MKTTFIEKNQVFLSFLLSLIFLAGCDLIDPTEVTNPNTTEDALEEGATGGTVPFLTGVQRNFTQALDELALIQETISDNYDNISTNLSDWPDIPSTILPENDRGYDQIQGLRALANFTLTTVIPNDKDATDAQKAEVLFLRGMANVLSAESYWAGPIAADQSSLTMKGRLDLAVADFNEALSLNTDSDFAARIHIVLARVHRLLGDKTNALSSANAAIASGSSDFVFSAEYDANTTTNDLYFFALSRSLHDLQPLPRLDFLDPKHQARDASVAAVKMEEAHLILAEVYLADGNFTNAKQSLADAITIAKARPMGTLDDVDPRKRTDPSFPSLPQVAGVTVKASPTSPEVSGLFLPRSGATVTIPTVSGTSLDADDVLALSTGTTAEQVELLRLVYLARQEIFFGEGRRMTDLGIRRPMSLTEIEQNETINNGDTGTSIYLPSYIPISPELDEMDRYDVQGNVVICNYDMNQVLADNRNNDYKPNSSDITTTLPFTFPF